MVPNTPSGTFHLHLCGYEYLSRVLATWFMTWSVCDRVCICVHIVLCTSVVDVFGRVVVGVCTCFHLTSSQSFNCGMGVRRM